MPGPLLCVANLHAPSPKEIAVACGMSDERRGLRWSDYDVESLSIASTTF
jgi:hypothetical protein